MKGLKILGYTLLGIIMGVAVLSITHTMLYNTNEGYKNFWEGLIETETPDTDETVPGEETTPTAKFIAETNTFVIGG